MDAFDAVGHAFATLSTGGFSTHDASFGHFNDNATLWVGSLFMTLGALPFTLYIMLAQFRMRDQIDPQILVFIALIVGTTLGACAYLAATWLAWPSPPSASSTASSR